MFNEVNQCEVCNKKIKLEDTSQLTTGEQVCVNCYETCAIHAQPND